MTARILVVDDDAAFRGMLVEALRDKEFDVDVAGSAEEGIRLAAAGDFDLVLQDVMLPGMSGIEALPHLKRAAPLADIVVMTAFSSRDSAVEALKRGAYDYFTKPFSLAEMEVVIRRALEKRRLQGQVQALRTTLEREGPLSRIIGQGQAMSRVKDMLQRVAGLDADVLITGESGTGKELVADTIHALSPRAAGPFVKLNCAAIPENLLESELFGHEKGAFTGATAARRGRFEMAQGGSILLDEIGDMPLHLQPKLLRAVEQKQVERVGGSRPVTFDVRIIAATNQDLRDRVEAKEFRADLYYRLNVAAIHLPPLRERKEDLALLADFFLDRIGRRLGGEPLSLAPDALRLLQAQDWPGNVRQLANTLERTAIFAASGRITAADLSLALQRRAEPIPEIVPPEIGLPLKRAVNEYEKGLIVQALRRAGGVQTEAARLLGITAKNLWNKLQKHGLDPATCLRAL